MIKVNGGSHLTHILKDIFGDTKRIRVLEELIENWGQFISIDEIARIAQTSKKTAYKHINELKAIDILVVDEGKPKRFKLKEDDKRALSLAILESEEYIRKSDSSIKELEKKEMVKKFHNKPFFTRSNSHQITTVVKDTGSMTAEYQLIGAESNGKR